MFSSNSAGNRQKRFKPIGRLALSVAAVVGLSITTACSSGPSAQPHEATEILIGGTYPLTGPLGDTGQDMVNAIKLAVQDVNTAGGVASLGGAKVVFKSLDSKGQTDQAVKNVQSLIQDGASLLIGSWLSADTLATTQIAEQLKIPHIVDQARTKQITERGYKYTFRTVFTPTEVASQTNELLDELIDTWDLNGKAAYMYEDGPFGSSTAEAVIAASAEHDVDIVEDVPYAASASDLSAEVARADASGADILLTTGYEPDTLMLLRTIAEQKANFKVIIGADNAAFPTASFAQNATDAGITLDGILSAGTYSADYRGETYDAYAERFETEFGYAPPTHTVMSYVSARLAIEAIEDAKSTKPEDIREALAKGTFEPYLLPQKQISFDSNGQNDSVIPLTYQFQGGSHVAVYPTQWAVADLTKPAAVK